MIVSVVMPIHEVWEPERHAGTGYVSTAKPYHATGPYRTTGPTHFGYLRWYEELLASSRVSDRMAESYVFYVSL